jgi:hypothetical protein
MQRAREIIEEGFGAAICSKALRGYLIGDRAHIEYVSFASLSHVLPKEVTEHSGGVHV